MGAISKYMSSGGPVVSVPTYELQVVGSNPAWRITLCNLFHHHCSQNGEGKHREETGMSQNHQIRRHVTSANPHWARVVDYGPLPLTREEACVPAVGTLQADDDDDDDDCMELRNNYGSVAHQKIDIGMQIKQ